MSLDDQISEHRAEIRTTQWSVSIGELMSLHDQQRLNINPAFQRFFRWTDTQKTYLVESILLGLPVPPIFLAQDPAGRLEVVDGVQRLSTLLQLRGALTGAPTDEGADASPRTRDPLILEAGQYLTALDGLVWDSDVAIALGRDPERVLTEAQRSDILFAKLDATVIQRTSGEQAKYDVFRRLNSYGEPLSPQEMRAALIASQNSACLSWLSELVRTDRASSLLSLSDRFLERQYDVELALRFFYLAETESVRLKDLRDFPKLLDDYGLSLAAEFPSRRTSRLGDAWNETMTRIEATGGGERFFRRYIPNEDRFRGGFLNTAFEALGSAVGYYLLRDKPVRSDLAAAAKEFWAGTDLTGSFATGKSTEARMAQFVPLGRRLLAG